LAETHYKAYQSLSSGTGYSEINSNVTSASYNITGLTNGTTYYFKVTAVNTVGESIDSVVESSMPIMTLTGVAINVSANQLTGTTTAMEYSLDSTKGTNGSWVTATSTNTSVTFDAGEVYVREIAAPSNFRVVTTLSAAALAPSGIAVDVAAGHITGTASGQEYSLDNGDTWADASATTTAVVFTGGEDVIVRVKATSTTLASLATSGASNGR
jgi:hypothetical protein